MILKIFNARSQRSWSGVKSAIWNATQLIVINGTSPKITTNHIMIIDLPGSGTR